MKKNYKKLLSIFCVGIICASASAQGTWKCTGTEASFASGVELTYVGITGLSVMHSDATGVIGKADDAPTTVIYHSITYDNHGIVQGATNAMYYTFRPTSNGVLDIANKMSSGKGTFVLEVSDDPATLIGSNPTASTIISAATFSTPSVYDTYNASTSTWNGTPAIQSSGSSQYLVMSFSVTANKTYVVGVNGSKFQLRGINYTKTAGTGVSPVSADKKTFSFQNPAKGNLILQVSESVQLSIYNTVGSLMVHKLVSPSDNNVDVSGLTPGVYFVKDLNNEYKTQKLIVE
jgi:hypothetical protein